MRRTVTIDCLPESARGYSAGWAVVAIDVIRATTSAITVAAMGGRCFPVATTEQARELAATLPDPLLAGECGGEMAPGFEMNNSPAELASRRDVSRPVILLSSSGTRLLCEASRCDRVYLACLRNWGYQARYLVGKHERIAIIGAGSRGQFREEDQLCCAWLAARLLAAGYEPKDERTSNLVARWATARPEAVARGESAKFLRRTGQGKDLHFILSHVNDLPMAFAQISGEVIAVSAFDAHVSPRPQIAGFSRPRWV